MHSRDLRSTKWLGRRCSYLPSTRNCSLSKFVGACSATEAALRIECDKPVRVAQTTWYRQRILSSALGTKSDLICISRLEDLSVSMALHHGQNAKCKMQNAIRNSQFAICNDHAEQKSISIRATSSCRPWRRVSPPG